MNAEFRSMSDLIADAEDLLAKVGRSQTPEVRALTDSVQLSVGRMKRRLRSRVRELRAPDGFAGSSTKTPWIYLAAGASLAIAVAAWRSRRPRR